MKKKAWPYVGSTEHEMGSMAPKGDPDRDIKMDPHGRYDSLVPTKFTDPDNQQPITNIEEGMIGHMDIEEPGSYNMSDDKKTKEKDIKGMMTVVILDDEDPVAEFDCDIAEDFNDKVAGLQVYPYLPKSAGLLFTYKRAQDVLYHMGTVAYPIDILFLDEENKIKKIYKNIQPGSLATFGCSGVKNVLEIYGGLSDRLGIRVGNKTLFENAENDSLAKSCSSLGIDKRIIYKYSNLSKKGFSKWQEFPVFTINDDILEKKASIEDLKIFSPLIDFFKKPKKVTAIYVDGLIQKNSNLNLFKKTSFNENNGVYRTVLGDSVSVGGSRKVHFSNLKKSEDEVILNSFKSFGDFIELNNESRKIFSELLRKSKDSNILFLTKYADKNLKNIVSKRIDLEMGTNGILLSSPQITLPNDFDVENTFSFLRKKFGKDVVLISDESLLKAAGVPVPEDIKQSAKKVYKMLDDAEKLVEQSSSNFQKNLIEYEKIKDDLEKIPKTKGQFNQSIKRQTAIIKKYLIKIRDGIRLFNEIKDISETEKIIDELATSSQQAAENAEDIFEMINNMEDPSFFEKFFKNSEIYEKSLNDLLYTIERAKDYINQHILGLTILSK